MDKKGNLKIDVLLCIILIILTAVIVGTLAWQMPKQKNDTIVNPNAVKELDVESELVQNLNKKILKYNNLGASTLNAPYFDGSFYKDTKVEYENLTNEEKIIAVINNIEPIYQYVSDIDTNKLIYNDIAYFDESSIIKVYTKELLEDVSKKVFGNNGVEIEWETLNMCASILDFVDGNYYEYDYEGGGFDYTENATSKIIKAEQQGEYIYLYDKFLYCDELEFYTENGEPKFYTSVNKTNELNNINGDNYRFDKINDILEQNIEKCPTYKHTFKIDNKGNCYWVSTEKYD